MPLPPPLKLGTKRIFGQDYVARTASFNGPNKQKRAEIRIPAFRLDVHKLEGPAVLEGVLVLLCGSGRLGYEVLG